MALRYVLDALRQPFNSKMFRFGMYALEQVCCHCCVAIAESPLQTCVTGIWPPHAHFHTHARVCHHNLQFKSRLVEWPQYTQTLASIPAIQQIPEMMAYIEEALRHQQQDAGLKAGKDRAGTPATQATSPSVGPPTGFGAATSIATLLMAQTGQQFVEPPEHIQDKIKFLFNNLTLVWGRGLCNGQVSQEKAVAVCYMMPVWAVYAGECGRESRGDAGAGGGDGNVLDVAGTLHCRQARVY